MSLLKGKKGIVTGVVNEYSYATHIVRSLLDAGATVGLTYLPVPAVERRIKKVAESHQIQFLSPMDASSDSSIQSGFAAIQKEYGSIDFFVHSIAFANMEDLKGRFIHTSRKGFELALGVSAYSLIPMAKGASELMPSGGAIVTLSYLGSEKVIPNYNVMGVAKAALECSVRYLAYDLGPQNIRVNAISAGPQKTLASSAVGDIDSMLEYSGKVSPLKRNVEGKEVGDAALYLVSSLSSGITGEILHVDCGYFIMGAPPAELGLAK
ncbi:MAG: enoyl-ACP reductase [Candidatus Omnitrophica bacterium]|nr:enoyl-ACP reductase [Candidatus Omnitrophota bacterium]